LKKVNARSVFAAGIRYQPILLDLEDELSRELHCPWIAYPSHSPESGRRGEGKRQGGEVCMVEDIENLPP
jgi:hypothetical protein